MTFGDQKDRDWFRPGTPIFTNPVHKVPSPEQQKHEEIKEIALRMIVETPLFCHETGRWEFGNLKEVWRDAEAFYNYAKEKRENEHE